MGERDPGERSGAGPQADWGLGRYEHTAAQLLPAARAVVDRAAPAGNERAVDIGCGTGNAVLLAAARGARVIGVDPAPRLLAVARRRAAADGLDVTFAPGEAAALPLADASVDVVLSVFGVIFAPAARAAAGEIARVTGPRGRLVLSAWIPRGALFELGRVVREAVARAIGASSGPPPFPWHDREALAGLLEPHGFAVTMQDERLAFTAPSARDYLDQELANHPLAVAARAILEPRGEMRAVEARALEILQAANEDPDGFRVTSHYIVATARRGPA